ncbi:MAG: hypothetical protein ACK55Z_12225, partial [bacterium]
QDCMRGTKATLRAKKKPKETCVASAGTCSNCMQTHSRTRLPLQRALRAWRARLMPKHSVPQACRPEIGATCSLWTCA